MAFSTFDDYPKGSSRTYSGNAAAPKNMIRSPKQALTNATVSSAFLSHFTSYNLADSLCIDHRLILSARRPGPASFRVLLRTGGETGFLSDESHDIVKP
jgi:hypothetical protein